MWYNNAAMKNQQNDFLKSYFRAGGMKTTFCLLHCLLGAAALTAGHRPYEFVDAGRTADANPALVDFESPGDWRVTCVDAAATFARAQDEQLFGDWTGRLVYRGTGPKPVVRVAPPAPIPVPGEDFDTLTAWVRGTRFGRGANRDPETPSPMLSAVFRLADGGRRRYELGRVDWIDWFLVQFRFPAADLASLRTASFDGFELTGGTQATDRTLHFDSISVFREKLGPVALKPRAKRNLSPLPGADQGLNTGDGLLPFPTREDTIMPDRAEPLPGEPLVRFTGGARAGSATNLLKVTTRRAGRTLIVDFTAPAGAVTEISAGLATEGCRLKGLDVPFLSYDVGGTRVQVDMLEGGEPKRTLFRLALFDWYRSNASTIRIVETPGGRELSVVYQPRSDGTYNPVSERLFITLSPDFAGVLPNIPNPKSPWKHVTGRKVWRSQASYDRALDRKFWRAVHRCGIREVLVTDHETMWRSGGESFTLRTSADPAKGGDAGQYEFTRFMRDELGYSYGPYNNYTDFAPANAHWNPDWVTRRADLSLLPAWMRCYAFRPAAAPEACEQIAPKVQEKFRFDTAYCDVHTAAAPWRRTDFDARVPGAGTFSETFYAWGETLLIQKRTWNGPAWSEGAHQFMYAGLVDGNYGQDWGYRCGDSQWLVDFDVLKIHPLETDFGMGTLSMFYPGKTALEKTYYLPHAPTPQAFTNLVDRFIGATLAFGHSGYLVLDHLFDPPKPFGLAYGCPAKMTIGEKGLALAMKSYFMVQQIAARYTQSEAASIAYADAKGRWLATGEALRADAVARDQVRVTYRDGTLVCANGNEKDRLVVDVGGSRIDLPPCGYFARSGDGEVEVLSCDAGGRRVDYCESPAYIYIDGRGDEVECGKARASGTAVCRATEDGWEIIPLGNRPCAFRICGGEATALDFDGKELGLAKTRLGADGWYSVEPHPGAFSYRVRRIPPMARAR